ncbi:putative ribonuclease H-like domain-containing protein [Tanacetum coccineum]
MRHGSESIIIFKDVQQGKQSKEVGKDAKGNTIVHPACPLDEHVGLYKVEGRIKLRLGLVDERIKEDEEDQCSNSRHLNLMYRIGHSYGVKSGCCSHNTYSLHWSCPASRSKSTYSDQQNIVSSVSQTSGRNMLLGVECEELLMIRLRIVDHAAATRLEVRGIWDDAGLKSADNGGEIAQKEKKEWEVKFEATLARFEKWKESSKNLKNLIDSSMSTRTKVGLGFQEYFGVDEVFDLSTPSVFYSDPVEKEVKPLYSTFVKAGEMHVVPPPITGTYMPSPYQSDIEETQVSYGSKSDNNISDTISESNDFVSCDNSDKSSDSETHASCDSSLKTQTKDIPPAVDIQTLPESDVEDPNSTTGSPSFSCSENVKSPRIICNKSGVNNRKVCKNNFVRVKKCFVCGSKLHLIKDCDFYNCVDSVPCKSKAASVSAGSRISPASVPAGRSDSAASRNRPAVHSAGSRISPASVPAGRSDSAASRNRPAVHSAGAPNHAGWSKRPATVSAGRPGSAGWLNPAARPYFRPSSVYFNTPTNLYDPMFMDKGRWDTAGDPSTDNDIGIVDSGCSRSMTGNKEKLADFVPIKGGIVKFGGGDGRISGKGTIRTSKLDFENVYYVEELQHFNLFSVSQICDKKNKVLFTDTDCLVLSEEFQLPDASQVVLRIPRKHDLYTFHISHLQPEQKVTCLVAKASLDESTRWHRRMAHVNFKTINKLAKEGLVDGLPLKVFSNEHNCVACNKGKQHKASYKHISAVRFITDTLQLLHMDLFGPTNIRSIDQKYYSLVVTDDFSRFSWTFFLGTKDETFYVLKEFITLIENQLNKKVKGIRCDNGTEFKNAKLIELCGEKGIKRDYSNPRTPQQNGVAERKNRTLIEAARTMLADSKLPTMFWTEAVSTACYVLNRVSITNPHNKTPYELISGKVPQIGHLKPFGCQTEKKLLIKFLLVMFSFPADMR